MRKQKPTSIHKFKKGDRITRIQPSKPIAKIQDEEIVNRNYIGTPFIFVGIANGCIYLKKFMDKNTAEMTALLTLFTNETLDDMINIELDIFEDGWAHYIDPEILENEVITNSITIEELESKKEEALKNENYEEVIRIQNQIKQHKK